MKLRCPISPSCESFRLPGSSSLTPPSRPAIHARRSWSRLSSNSCVTLIRGMGLPFGDQPVHRLGGRRAEQLVAKRPVAEHLRQLAQYLQMQIGRALGHQQHENQVDRQSIGGVERDRLPPPPTPAPAPLL